MRSYTLTNLVKDSEYNITIGASNGAGSASSTIPTIRTSVSAMFLVKLYRI